jgi:CDP-4-dehydro-6-deoxyglucose reductase
VSDVQNSGTVTVTFMPNQVTMRCRTDQTLMDAAREHGIKMKTACKNGVCEICAADWITGALEFTNPMGSQILDKNNRVLCCVAIPKTDTQIFMANVQQPDFKHQVNLAMQIQSVVALNDEVYAVELLAPAGKVLDFWPGQYLMLPIQEADGATRQIPYSIASAPGSLTGKEPRLLELHIANASDTAARMISQLQNSPTITVTLPMGDCFVSPTQLQACAGKPIILIAAGTGFAQIKALAEGILALAPEQEIHLYWSNRSSGGFYMADLPRQWDHDHANLHFHPILEQHADGWNGRAGWIYQVIQHDFKDLNGVHAYACGSPNMVYGTLDQLEPLGLSEANLHSDVLAYAPRPQKA